LVFLPKFGQLVLQDLLDRIVRFFRSTRLLVRQTVEQRGHSTLLPLIVGLARHPIAAAASDALISPQRIFMIRCARCLALACFLFALLVPMIASDDQLVFSGSFSIVSPS
jgi:hypothetical protein